MKHLTTQNRELSEVVTPQWLSNQTIETILMNPELVTLRSITHRNTTDEEKRLFGQYRVLMAGEFAKSLNYIKTGVSFDKDMCIEFVDAVVLEFPNWKPEDFMLWCRMAREGKFRDKFEQTVDYPMLMSWLHKYDEKKAQLIEAERVIEAPKEVIEPDREYTQEEVDKHIQDFYQMMENKQKERRDKIPHGVEPEFMALQRRAYQAYRKEAERVSMTETNSYMQHAAKVQWMQQNNEVEWCKKWVEENG